MSPRAVTVLSPEARELSELVSRSGRNQKETADYLTRRLGRDVTNVHVSRWVNGGVKVPVDVMDAMRELAAQPAESPPVVSAMTDSDAVVPLFGYANAAGAVLRLNEDQRVGVVPIHPAQRGSRSAFAFIVFGESLSPRLSHGEIAYAVRGRMPARGQPFLLELKNGDVLVKIFDTMDDRTLFGRQLEPKKDLSWPLREVEAIHAVVGVSFGSQ